MRCAFSFPFHHACRDVLIVPAVTWVGALRKPGNQSSRPHVTISLRLSARLLRSSARHPIPITLLTDLHNLNAQQRPQLFDLAGDVPDTNGGVMGRAVPVPFVDKAPRADRETIPAV